MRFRFAVVATICFAVPAVAAIIPTWRVNPIPPVVIALDPQLANAGCVSLLVTLTGDSRFVSAGIKIPNFPVASGVPIYNHPFGSNGPPNPLLLSTFPELAFDSYVAVTSASLPTITGSFFAPGGAGYIGPDGLDVAWSDITGSGPPGAVDVEIARITFVDAGPFVDTTDFAIGEVRASPDVLTAVPLPPMPTPARYVPDPACAAIGLVLMTVRRRLVADRRP